MHHDKVKYNITLMDAQKEPYFEANDSEVT